MLWTTPAQAEITQCTNITTLPAVISTQGVYCLKQDLATNMNSGNAITINANNVTLDCNDWKIGGLAAGTTTNASGISTNKLNTTIRNCGIRGFRFGMRLNGGGGYLVEDNRIDHNTETGIQIHGDASTVRRNRILDTRNRLGGQVTYGMDLRNVTGTVVTENLITNVSVIGNTSGNGNSYGIRMNAGSGIEISRNTMANIIPAGSGRAFGTRGDTSGPVYSLRDNTAINSVLTNGVGIDGGSTLSHCKGNSSHGFSTGLAWCADLGGNSSN